MAELAIYSPTATVPVATGILTPFFRSILMLNTASRRRQRNRIELARI